jgi:hypothetical protein
MFGFLDEFGGEKTSSGRLLKDFGISLHDLEFLHRHIHDGVIRNKLRIKSGICNFTESRRAL